MADKVYISWTLQNWITIVLMVIIAGFAVNLGTAAFDKVTS